MSVTAAADHLGVARSTAHRMLSTLLAEGFIRQDPATKSYLPGRRMLELGLAAVRNLDVRAAARPELEALRDELGETVHLVLLEGRHILFVDSVESTRAVRVGSRVGLTDARPLHRRGQGDPRRAAARSRWTSTSTPCPAALTPHSITDRDAVPAEIELTGGARLRDQLRGERGRAVRRRRCDSELVRRRARHDHDVVPRRAAAARARCGGRRAGGPQRPGDRRAPARPVSAVSRISSGLRTGRARSRAHARDLVLGELLGLEQRLGVGLDSGHGTEGEVRSVEEPPRVDQVEQGGDVPGERGSSAPTS